MNKVILMGTLIRDPEIRTTQSNVPVASFCIAVDRAVKNANGEREADFLNCTAWRQQAELVAKYFHKGSRILLVGSIQNHQYTDKDGNKRTSTDIQVSEISFVDKASKSAEKAPATSQGAVPSTTPSYYPPALMTPEEKQMGFSPVPDDDTSLPFDL